MIKIKNKAIDRALKQTRVAYFNGRLEEFHQVIEEKLKIEQPVLSDYIQSGYRTLSAEYQGDESAFIKAGYQSASYLTFRMVEEQCKIDLIQSPKVIVFDIERANDRCQVLNELHKEFSVRGRLIDLLDENRDFGEYVIDYVYNQALNDMVARGFALGIVGTYSVYEQTFARIKNLEQKK